MLVVGKSSELRDRKRPNSKSLNRVARINFRPLLGQAFLRMIQSRTTADYDPQPIAPLASYDLWLVGTVSRSHHLWAPYPSRQSECKSPEAYAQFDSSAQSVQ
jgi:hypothetical protein